MLGHPFPTFRKIYLLINNNSPVLNSVQSHAIFLLILYHFSYLYALNKINSKLPLALV